MRRPWPARFVGRMALASPSALDEPELIFGGWIVQGLVETLWKAVEGNLVSPYI